MNSWQSVQWSLRGTAKAGWILAVVVVTAIFAEELREADPIGPDLAIEQSVESIRNPGLLAVARDITALGSLAVIGFGCIGATAFMLATRQRRLLARVAVTVLGAVAIVHFLKHFVGRARPLGGDHLAGLDAWSFPSGHTLVSTAFYLGLAPILASQVRSTPGRRIVIALCCGCTGMVGVSRVYLGVHYASDVVAGWALGSAWILCAAWITSWPRAGGLGGRVASG